LSEPITEAAGAIEALALPPLPFESSRRLTGPNLHFAGTGAALETQGAHADDAAAIAGWRVRVERMRTALGWPAQTVCVRRHAGGAALAFEAPIDQLYTATEVNEWAWLSELGVNALHAPGHPPACMRWPPTRPVRRCAPWSRPQASVTCRCWPTTRC
jgi:hypothetical protein